MRNGTANDELIVRAVVARRVRRGRQGPPDQVEPASRHQVVGGDIPVSADDPRAVQGAEDPSNPMQQVEFLPGASTDGRIEPDRREVEAPVDHSPDVLHREAGLETFPMEGG